MYQRFHGSEKLRSRSLRERADDRHGLKDLEEWTVLDVGKRWGVKDIARDCFLIGFAGCDLSAKTLQSS
jgi:hypothetical protein